MPTARRLCVKFEGIRLKPYLCPAGIATIGIGNTTYEDGRPVTLKDPPITPARAAQLLDHTLRRVYVPGTLKQCPGLRNEPLGAIADFAYNLGVTRLAGSTLKRRINAGDWEGAKRELAKWVRGGGRKLPGLVARRAAESGLLPE